MRVGVRLPNDAGPTREAIQRVATAAEELGFDSLWIDAHVVVPADVASRYPFSRDGRPTFGVESPFADPFITLAFAAAATSRVRLGTAVMPWLATHPLSLAKQVATLDVLSSGRVELGLGAGWLLEEAALLDRPADHRIGRLGETLDLLRAAWRDGTVTWEGQYFHFPTLGVYPRPPQGEALPLWLGGIGSATVRLAARKGAGLLISRGTPERVAEYRGRLEAAGGCRAIGASMLLAESPAESVASASALRDAGLDLLIVGSRYEDGRLIDRLRAFARDVLPAL